MEKNALVTGSSRGIGRAIARSLAENGWGVCINCIERTDLAEALVNELRSNGFRAMYAKADVSDKTQVQEMFKKAQTELGEIELLVNNAGISLRKQFQDITSEEFRRIFQVNVEGMYNCIQAVLPLMLHEHRGSIVNISSIWGNHGGSCETAYSASKHAVEGLTRALSAELSSSGIRVNAVAPGVIATDMLSSLGEETAGLLKEELPMGFGKPEDVAEAVRYLAEAGYITGQILTVDGGFLI